MVNHRKVIFSLLKEIKENKSESKAGDYGLETAEFGTLPCQAPGLVKLRLNYTTKTQGDGTS